ncbi:hypothetical protein A2U01_0065705, partial [Trifolium medium]|nr:hypothetical protein [Trifolium medium]
SHAVYFCFAVCLIAHGIGVGVAVAVAVSSFGSQIMFSWWDLYTMFCWISTS